MKFKEVLSKLGGQGFFDLASVVQLTAERRKTVQMQLYRWCKGGKLHPLRRGMYAFAEPYITRAVNPAELANHLYRPSYLSTYWALGYYGLIPERVVTHTSISSRVTRSFENVFGAFSYRHVKASAFFGYHPVRIDDRKVLLAEPEKALLDLWYLESGEWTMDRLREMRFEDMELVDVARLREYAERFASRRLIGVASKWSLLRAAEEEGTVQL